MISDPYFITYLIQWDISRALIYILAASPLASSGFAVNRLSCFGEGGWIPNLFSPKPSQDHREATHKISSQSEYYK